MTLVEEALRQPPTGAAVVSLADGVAAALERWRSLITVPETDAAQAKPAAESDIAQMPTIAVVADDRSGALAVIELLSDAGFARCVWTDDAAEALAVLRRQRPDIVLLEISPPGRDGIELLRQLHDDERLTHVPTIVLTSADDRELRRCALELGAGDFLAKPIDPTELVPRVRNAWNVRSYQERLERQACELDRVVRERTAELALSRLELIHCLGRAAEYRDNETGRHVVRVGHYVGVLARQLGLEPRLVELMELAAPLHDVGKIGIPDSILRKPGSLARDEYRIMQQHCDLGSRIFNDAADGSTTDIVGSHPEMGLSFIAEYVSPVLRMAASIAVTHHERWDGTGYPNGLKGTQIPLEGRITAVADVFDAISTHRVYKSAYPLEQCFQILREGRGTHFDPDVLDAFFVRLDDILAIYREFGDAEEPHAVDVDRLH
jgi:putative two-component system response regulator